MTRTRLAAPALMLTALLLIVAAGASAHDVAATDRAFVQGVRGADVVPFLYLGAKHMVTGYDHILFLIGVIFYLHRLRDVFLYVSMFTIGHSLTLMGGVLMGVGMNSYIIDAIIGLSVVYKGVENLGGLSRIGWRLDTRIAIFIFGLFHGAGLATKLMDLSVSPDGLLANLIGFNVGIELGQVLVLALVVSLLNLARRARDFAVFARYANIALVIAGATLTASHIAGFLGL